MNSTGSSKNLKHVVSTLVLGATAIVLYVTWSSPASRPVSDATNPAGDSAKTKAAQRISPHETVELVTKAGTISVEYGRPFKRGRKIWGGLVPWHQWWMPGADEATLLRIDHSIILEGLLLPTGEYSLYIWVDPHQSKLIVNRQVGQSHKEYNSARDLGRIDFVRTDLATVVEQMTFALVDLGNKEGAITLAWDMALYRAQFVSK